MSLDGSIPPNTYATIYLPSEKVKGVKESGKATTKSEGAKFIKPEAGKAIYEIASGNYHFTSKAQDLKKTQISY